MAKGGQSPEETGFSLTWTGNRVFVRARARRGDPSLAC